MSCAELRRAVGATRPRFLVLEWAVHTKRLARTPKGPVLFTGDACHSAWGWQHQVEPGTFSVDRAASADSLARLERFAARHPSLVVRVGHQELPAP